MILYTRLRYGRILNCFIPIVESVYKIDPLKCFAFKGDSQNTLRSMQAIFLPLLSSAGFSFEIIVFKNIFQKYNKNIK